MKHIIIKSLCFLALYLLSGNMSFAQVKNIPAPLQARIAGKTTLKTIMAEVDDYYESDSATINTLEENKETDYGHWKRWEWWMSSHLDGNGEFVEDYNKKNRAALNEVDLKYGSAIKKDNENKVASKKQIISEERGGMASREQSSFGQWSNIGPTADEAGGSGDFKGLGRFDRIAFHPSNQNIIYIGTPSGQMFKTTNAGGSWFSVTDALGNSGIGGIAVSPTNGNVVYVLTGSGDGGGLVSQYGSSPSSDGVYKSTDGGVSWSKTGDLYTGSSTFIGRRLTVSGSSGNILIAATNQGLYRTENGGTSWEQVRTGSHWDVKYKPGDDNIVYATTSNNILYSNSSGDLSTWSTATTDFSISGSVRINLAVAPSNPARVYAICGNASTGSFTGLFRSTNSGQDYERRTNTPNILGSEQDGSDNTDQSDYDLGITVLPTNSNRIATCGLTVWTSTDGGSNMTWSTKFKEGYAGAANKYIHPDIHDVQYNPLNNNLYAASDGGIYVSTDEGVSWSDLNNGLATSQFFGMAMRDIDGNGEADGIGLLAGAQDNGIKFRTFSGGSTYRHAVCCDGYGTAIAPDNADLLYFNVNTSFYKSTDAGMTRSRPFPNNTEFSFFSPIAIDYNYSDTVYIGGTSTRRTYDGFSNIPAVTTIGTSTRRVLSTCPSNSSRLYASSGNNVIFSSDRASTWDTQSGNPGWPAGTFTINDIEASPTNSNTVYVSLGGYSDGNKVMRSTNRGDNWTNWSAGLPNVPTYGLSVSSEGVYIGTEIGVFFRATSMTDWVPYYNGMPRIAVTEMFVNENGLIYAATFGRGVWLSQRRTDCDNSLLVSGVKNGLYYYEAGQNVSATMTSPGSIGNEVYMQAGDEVTLSEGFEVEAGAFFRGYISPCSNGGLPTGKTAEKIIAYVPNVEEVKYKLSQQKPQNDYAKIEGNFLEVNLNAKASLSFFAKENGTWKAFYPEEEFVEGTYRLPLPQLATEGYKVTANGTDLLNIEYPKRVESEKKAIKGDGSNG